MSVEVKLELGHRARLRDKPTTEGFTHDWTVFVRGPEGSSIQYFVDKVVFHLHESFPKPKRVVKDPPYQVSESGYAGFIMPIEVYFRSKEEPKKVRFEYDLYLRLEGPPVSNIRFEKLTFQNPTDDFRRKLLKAGGVGVIGAVGTGGASLQTQACAPVQHNEEHRPPGHTKASAGLAEKKPRSHSTVKPTTPTDHVTNQRSNSDIFSQSKKAPRHLYMSTSDESPIGGAELNRHFRDAFGDEFNNRHSCQQVTSQSHRKHPESSCYYPSSAEPVKPSPPVRTSQPFTDIFGTPIKAKHSPDPSAKTKDSVHSSQQKSNKISPGGTPSSSAGSKEPKAVFKESHPLDPKESKQLKPQKSDKEVKLAVKRASPSPIQSVNLGLDKKRRRSSLSSEGNERPNDVPKAKVKDGKEKKERHKNKVPSGANVSKKEKDKSKPRVLLPPIEIKDTTKSPKASNQVTKIVSPVPEPCIQELETNGVNDAINKSHDSSPASSISLSSLPSGGAHGPLAAMMAEMENELLSPLSSDPGNSPQQLKDKQLQNSDNEVGNVHVSEDKPVLKPTVKAERKLKQKSEGKSKFIKSSKTIENCANLENNHHDPPIDEKDVKQNKGNHIDPAYLRELVDLQRKIMGLSDRHLLQRIVDVIEETGRYQVTNSTFDFDLCTLDQSTVRKLKNCLTVK